MNEEIQKMERRKKRLSFIQNLLWFLSGLTWYMKGLLVRSEGDITKIFTGIITYSFVFIIMYFLFNKVLVKVLRRIKKSYWYRCLIAKITIKKNIITVNDGFGLLFCHLSEDEIEELFSEDNYKVFAQNKINYINQFYIGSYDSLYECISAVMRYKKVFAGDSIIEEFFLGEDALFFIYKEGKITPISDDIEVLKKYHKDIPEDRLEKMLKKAEVLADLQ